VAVSRRAAHALACFLGLRPERVAAIPNPSVTDEMLARARAPVDDPWFGEKRDAKVIVFAGRLVAKKGVATLVEAFARVRSRRAARLFLMGEGPERARIEALVSAAGLAAHVRLAGYVENPFARLARADLFVLSSRAEGMPNALIEALACGCPVVSTDCPSGPSEILEGGAYGRLTRVGDAAALADAIVATLDAPPARERLRERGRLFHIDRIVGRYADVLVGPTKRASSP
jgi:glycosyltransferase involved in cell wall biosynthesis